MMSIARGKKQLQQKKMIENKLICESCWFSVVANAVSLLSSFLALEFNVWPTNLLLVVNFHVLTYLCDANVIGPRSPPTTSSSSSF